VNTTDHRPSAITHDLAGSVESGFPAAGTTQSVQLAIGGLTCTSCAVAGVTETAKVSPPVMPLTESPQCCSPKFPTLWRWLG